METLENGLYVRVVHSRNKLVSKGKEVGIDAKGGRTLVQLVEEDGTVVAEGQAVCSHLDNFNRRLGRTIALGRAKKMLREHPAIRRVG